MYRELLQKELQAQIKTLDQYQKEFVQNDSNIVKVLANAGSGKTHSSVIKILSMVIEKQIPPEEIVMISYTNKAAKVLSERYYGFFKKALEKHLEPTDLEDYLLELKIPQISTIHSFALKAINGKLHTGRFTILNDNKASKQLRESVNKVLKDKYGFEESIEANLMYPLQQHITSIGNKSEYGFFIKIDLDETFKVLSITKENQHEKTSWTYNKSEDFQKQLQEIKLKEATTTLNILNNSKKLKEKNITLETSILEDILIQYFKDKLSKKCLAFIDILYISLLYQFKFKNLSPKSKIFLIDEAQDLDYTNFFLTRKIFMENDGIQYTLIGDTKQSLYSFRDADPFILNDLFKYFSEDFTKGTVRLLSNYRSNGNLVRMANYFARNTLSRYFEFGDSQYIKDCLPGCLVMKTSQTFAEEANYILGELQTLVEKGYDYKDITFLTRSNQNLINIEPYFILNRIPYKLKYDTRSMINSSAFKFIYAIFSHLLNPQDIDSLLEILEYFKGYGDKGLQKLKNQYQEFYEDTVTFAKGNQQIKKINDILLEPIRAEYNSRNFNIVNLSRIIKNIIINQLNYSFTDDEGHLQYVNNTDENINITLTLEQINKGTETILSLYESYQQDYGFKAKEEVEKFIDIYQALAATQAEKDEHKKDTVLISTVHGYKGLENKVVFYFGTSSLKPFAVTSPLEDLCILYVAITRAIDKLYVTGALKMTNIYKQEEQANLNPHLSIYKDGMKEL